MQVRATSTVPAPTQEIDLPSYILLDVDGVVAPIRPEGPGAWPPTDADMLRLDGAEDELLVLADLGPWLLSLDAELIWLTTWQSSANEVIGPRLGLPRQAFLSLPDDRGDRWAKARAVRSWVKECSADIDLLVWVDDHARRFGEDVTWALEGMPAPSLVLTPGPHRGIDRRDMQRVEAFLATAE